MGATGNQAASSPESTVDETPSGMTPRVQQRLPSSTTIFDPTFGKSTTEIAGDIANGAASGVGEIATDAMKIDVVHIPTGLFRIIGRVASDKVERSTASSRGNRMNMHWITSAGGPLVLVPEKMAAQWHGVSDGGGDYAAACTIDDYIGVIRWHGVDVLVLNDEPLATTCITDGLTIFLRWMYAPNEDAITNVIQGMARHFPKQQGGAALDCQASRYILFDAGASAQNSVERIEVEVAPGPYMAETHVWTPNEDVGLVVHVLRPT